MKMPRLLVQLSSKEKDIVFSSNDIIESTSANMYSLDQNIHYTICLNFEIGGSIPPSIPVNSFFINYDNGILDINRIKTNYDDDDYLNYVIFYDLFIFSQAKVSSVVFSIEDVATTMVSNTNK